MSLGKIKGYDPRQGCGDIVDSETSQHLTVYANYVQLKEGQVLREGQDVEYEIESHGHKNWAINVRILEKG